jgi:hypothetical protein
MAAAAALATLLRAADDRLPDAAGDMVHKLKRRLAS